MYCGIIYSFFSSFALQFKYFLKDPVKYDVKYQVYDDNL